MFNYFFDLFIIYLIFSVKIKDAISEDILLTKGLWQGSHYLIYSSI